MEQSEHFSRTELSCRHTGLCEMDEEFMKVLEDVRRLYDKPMILSSAFRDKTHPAEVNKKTTGIHTIGWAVDILVMGADRYLRSSVLMKR